MRRVLESLIRPYDARRRARVGRVLPVVASLLFVGPLAAQTESVGRILRAWNVSADSVVFVDDSPLELAEVQAVHPGIETVLFPREHEQAAYELLGRLRDVFGKSAVREEDRLRCITSGFQAHLPKPIDPRELVAVVAHLASRNGSGTPQAQLRCG